MQAKRLSFASLSCCSRRPSTPQLRFAARRCRYRGIRTACRQQPCFLREPRHESLRAQDRPVLRPCRGHRGVDGSQWLGFGLSEILARLCGGGGSGPGGPCRRLEGRIRTALVVKYNIAENDMDEPQPGLQHPNHQRECSRSKRWDKAWCGLVGVVWFRRGRP